jgi:DNA-binding NarL/FixJ family response regulator
VTAALKILSGAQLRVALLAPDTLRRRTLSKILVDAEYTVVEIDDRPDIVLADGVSVPSNEDRPVVILGDSDQSAQGSLPRDASAHQIDAALRAVAAGLSVRFPAATEPGFLALDESDVQKLLTPRELDVLEGIIDGLTNKMIARQLDISLHTVKFHVESVFRKLGARTRAEAVAKALDSGHLKTIKL